MNTTSKALIALVCVAGLTSILTAGCHDDHPRRHLRYRRYERHHFRPRVIYRERPSCRVERVEKVRIVESRKHTPKACKGINRNGCRDDHRRGRVVRRQRTHKDKESFHVTIINRTRKKLDLELEGKHEGDDDIGKVYPGEAFHYRMVVKSKKLPEKFELEAGKHEIDFLVTRCSPRKIILVVTRHGIFQG